MQINSINHSMNFGVKFTATANNAIKNQLAYYTNCPNDNNHILDEKDDYETQEDILRHADPEYTIDVRKNGSVLIYKKPIKIGELTKDSKYGNRIDAGLLNKIYHYISSGRIFNEN